MKINRTLYQVWMLAERDWGTEWALWCDDIGSKSEAIREADEALRCYATLAVRVVAHKRVPGYVYEAKKRGEK